MPPSAMMTEPVMKLASGDARKAAECPALRHRGRRVFALDGCGRGLAESAYVFGEP